MYRVLVVAIGTLLEILLLTYPSTGQTIGAVDQERTIAKELKALQDPTIFVRRVWLDSEWDKFNNGSSDLQHTLGGVWAWPISNRQDLGVRLTVPFKAHFAGDAVDDLSNRALGDVELAIGTAFKSSGPWRAGGGIQLHMPSGTSISSNTWRLQEVGAVAWDATPWLTFSPSFEHNHSYAEQRGVDAEHYLELFFPATLLMQGQWAVTAAYEPKLDFENHNRFTHSVRLQLAKRLQELPLSLSFSIKTPFNSDKQFQLNFVSTYYFSPTSSERSLTPASFGVADY